MNKVDWHDCKSYESYVIILTQNKRSNTIFKHIQPPLTLPNRTIFVWCSVNVLHMEWIICWLTHFIHLYHAYNWLFIWFNLPWQCRWRWYLPLNPFTSICTSITLSFLLMRQWDVIIHIGGIYSFQIGFHAQLFGTSDLHSVGWEYISLQIPTIYGTLCTYT